MTAPKPVTIEDQMAAWVDIVATSTVTAITRPEAWGILARLAETAPRWPPPNDQRPGRRHGANQVCDIGANRTLPW